MPALVPKGRGEDYPALDVPDDQVEFWEAAGYVAATPAKPEKKSGAKKSKK